MTTYDYRYKYFRGKIGNLKKMLTNVLKTLVKQVTFKIKNLKYDICVEKSFNVRYLSLPIHVLVEFSTRGGFGQLIHSLIDLMGLVLQTNSQTRSILKHIIKGVSFLRKTQPCMKYIATGAGNITLGWTRGFFTTATGEIASGFRHWSWRLRESAFRQFDWRFRCRGARYTGLGLHVQSSV